MATISVIEPLGTRQVPLPLLMGGDSGQLAIPDAPVALRLEQHGAQYWLRLVDAGAPRARRSMA